MLMDTEDIVRALISNARNESKSFNCWVKWNRTGEIVQEVRVGSALSVDSSFVPSALFIWLKIVCNSNSRRSNTPGFLGTAFTCAHMYVCINPQIKCNLCVYVCVTCTSVFVNVYAWCAEEDDGSLELEFR